MIDWYRLLGIGLEDTFYNTFANITPGIYQLTHIDLPIKIIALIKLPETPNNALWHIVLRYKHEMLQSITYPKHESYNLHKFFVAEIFFVSI